MNSRGTLVLSRRVAKQRGVVLVVSLVILLAMSLIGITAMQVTMLEERMSGNQRDRNLAFQAAESSLVDAVEWILNLASAPVVNATGSNGVWSQGEVGPAPDRSLFGEPGAAVPTGVIEYGAQTSAPDLEGVADEPRFVVEEFQFVADDLSAESLATRTGVIYYTVTALGYGGSPNARTMLQAVAAKRYR